jgi:putative DNA primase/helicase
MNTTIVTQNPAIANLAQLPQWVYYQPRRIKQNGKIAKAPLTPSTGRHAKVNDPKTWSSFQEALHAAERHPPAGVGFMITKETGLIGIDLDNCVGNDGRLNEFASQVVDELKDTYCEISAYLGLWLTPTNWAQEW